MSKYEQLQEYLKDNQNTWLVTGVAGFIGSNLAKTFIKNKHNVYIYSQTKINKSIKVKK